jgi:hypothetical protein
MRDYWGRRLPMRARGTHAVPLTRFRRWLGDSAAELCHPNLPVSPRIHINDQESTNKRPCSAAAERVLDRVATSLPEAVSFYRPSSLYTSLPTLYICVFI